MTGWTKHTSPRKAELPPDWDQIRAEVLERAEHQCEAIEHDQRCTATATDADHIDRLGPHEMWNLQALCHPCHMRKTQADGVKQRKANIARARRKPIRHPGLR